MNEQQADKFIEQLENIDCRLSSNYVPSDGISKRLGIGDHLDYMSDIIEHSGAIKKVAWDLQVPLYAIAIALITALVHFW